MLYDIYENTIGMIEELEKHEDHGRPARLFGIVGSQSSATQEERKA